MPPSGETSPQAHHCGYFGITLLQTLLLSGGGRDRYLPAARRDRAIRLIDLDGLEQEEAAEKLGVSRKTAWRDLHEARRKIADALVNGKGIEMAGCQKAAEGRCPKCPR